MNRHQLIVTFIRSVLEMIMAPKFLASEYKRKRNEYFLRTHKGSRQGVPSNKEIAAEALRYLIKIGRTKSDSDLHEILTLPFFSKYVRNPTPHYDYIRAKRREDSTFDISGVADLERAQHALAKMKEEMIREAQTEIDEAIAKKKAEYYSLPSILDEVDPPEPEIIEEVVEDDERYTPWWKRLGLVSDPFPTVDGLQMIDTRFYDQIVYKTDMCSEFSFYAQDTPDELFKNTIIFGEFGAGKTTLFEYLNKVFWDCGITALILQVYTESNIHTQTIRFRQELVRSIKTILAGSIDQAIAAGTFQDIDQQIIELLKSYSDRSETKGVIVFIDDLHKNIAGMEVSLEFLNYLQTFTSKLNGALGGLRVTFYIAGSLQWQNAIRTEERYSGSLPRRKIIPPISPEDAHLMLNQRLAAFDPNPELKREFKTESINRVYSILKQANLPLTFRSFISKAVEDFQNGNFDILTADPIHIPTATLEGIRELFDSDAKTGPEFERMLDGVKETLNQRELLRTLIRLFLIERINETDSWFIDKQFFFKRLVKSKLIQKMRDKEHGFVWVVSPNLISLNSKVMEKYAVSLENYLLSLYGFPQKRPIGASEELELIDRLIDTSEDDDLKRMLSEVKELHARIVGAQVDYAAKAKPETLRKLCLKSLETLSLSYFIHMDQFETKAQPLKAWTEYWFFPPEVGQFLDSVKGLQRIKYRIWYIVNMYRQTFTAVSGFILRQLERSDLFPIRSRDLTRKESEVLAKISWDWIERRYVNCVGTLRLLLQERKSIFLYNNFLLLFGEFDNRIRHVPQDLRKRLSEAITAESHSNLDVEEFNEFDGLNLVELAKTMSGSEAIATENWRNLFSFVFEPMKEEDFLNTLVQIDKLCGVKDWSEGKVEDLRILVWDSADILRRMNASYVETLRRGVFLDEDKPTGEVYIGQIQELVGGLEPIHFDCEAAERVLMSLSSERVPLDDPQFIQSSYGCSYRFFFALVGLGAQDLLDKVCHLKTRIALLSPRGPSLSLEVVRESGAANKSKTTSIEQPTLDEILVRGEDDRTEFKASFRWDNKTEKTSKKQEFGVVKTIAALMNTSGGTLAIGLDNDGVPVGLNGDYSLTNVSNNRDRFKNELKNALNGYGLDEVHIGYYKVKFVVVDNNDICLVHVAPSKKCVYLSKIITQKGALREAKRFPVRQDGGTSLLQMDAAVEWMKAHRPDLLK